MKLPKKEKKSLLRKNNMKIPLSNLYLKGNEKKYVDKLLKNGKLSMGEFTEKFENIFKDYIGRKFALVVSSGTAGLFLLLKASGIKDGDEIITTPFSFIASSNVILHSNATPVFVDIDEKTFCISSILIEEKIKKDYRKKGKNIVNKKSGKILKGVLSVDILGNVCDYEKLEELCKEYNLTLFEDSSESLGSEINGKRSGIFGKGSVFAFYPNKQITTGEGGIILTDDEKLYSYIKALRNQGRVEGDPNYIHRYLGYNFRVSDINSAIGFGQMEILDEILKKRNLVAKRYFKMLKDIDGIKLPSILKGQKNSWFLFYILVDPNIRDNFIDFLNRNGVSSKRYFYPIHLQPFYKTKFGYKRGDFPISEKISDQLIAIPFYTNMKYREQLYVYKKFKEFFERKSF
ncbi:MAG: DegT/DnrJ/EryC1/StrS aminotransferase [candidate division TA06 bacterium 32_111]|uniref:DegT/DnrJ/EryC1/StrS aminotransferase n=2 Tax=Bacteria candidate phyla TaxID=1783234 RepID=A0A101I2F1_UNCT6|nr:MAG: DegT/DnrJ/EryC1/StrS aminotransferase [candidate division TA06 bacterium 32_111]KUK87498.1 MAG: DegT/DnrJ/EryC1/StrS aminotransferase [candidate division TA06 bacterium 34_109]HAF08165.1 polysaccharide biosynthesis protein [candidate division WOR-3 bacterium]HCP16727.1 polysaccharide biosynthesis protein [candidate division WOR-3 bacterium]